MPSQLSDDETRLRLLVHLAGESAGRTRREAAAWAHDELGYTTDAKNYDHVAKRAEQKTEIWTAHLANGEALGLKLVLFRIEGHARGEALIEAINDVPGVAWVLELDDSLDLLVLSVVEDDQEAARLRSALMARVPKGHGVAKHVISRLDFSGETRTWETLARRHARRLLGE